MSLALAALQGLALACAGLALALPAYVFVVVIWSASRTLVADLAHWGQDGWATLATGRARRYAARSRAEASVGATAIP